jgi:hypothetical protein
MSCSAVSAEALIGSNNQQANVVYNSPQERREAGARHVLGEGFSVVSLLELEKYRLTDKVASGQRSASYDEVAVLQLGLLAELSDWVQFELLLEAEHDTVLRSWVDEVMLEVGNDDVALKLGKFYLPFGEYRSHFITGPLLEFAESRHTAVQLQFSLPTGLALATYAFRSKVQKQSLSQHNGGDLDWGVSVNFTSSQENVRMGLGYVSDLAESDEQLLADNGNEFQRRVDAGSANFLYGWSGGEVSAELIHALDEFAELDGNYNRPRAANFETALLVKPQWQLAFRYEISRDMAAPQRQYGLALTFLAQQSWTLGFEALQGRYARAQDFDDQDRELRSSRNVAAKISMAL